MTLPPWVPKAWAIARVQWKPLVITAAFVLFWFVWCDRPHPGPIPTKEQHSLDSADITKPIFQAARDTLIRRETTFVRKTIHDTAAARQLFNDAAVAKAIADSLQTIALRADSSATLWHRVADARTLEATDLRHVVDTLATALQNEKAARLAADSRVSLDSSRLKALDDLSHRLAADVKKASECRVLLVLGCPSRKASFVAGAVTAVGAGLAIHYARP